MSGPEDLWRSTELWQRLHAADDSVGVAAAVAQQMPAIERVLAQAATSPRHFTLHDGQHSWRVAQQMRRLIPDAVWQELSPPELALLLLSAYLHDIGMTPAHQMVAAHHALLVDGRSDALSPSEVAAFQEWLDRTHPGVEIAAATGTADVERLREVDLLVAAYVRYRHVDWSEDWMRDHLPDDLLPGYPHALDDLVALCRSHHEGLRALTARAFDPTFLDGGAIAVHRRYLAAVLRVADVLDVDPERTPTVVFQHRDVAAESVVYWYKDHDLSISVERSRRVIAEAFPRSAVIHRAVEETVEQIDAELRLVQALDAQTPFEVAPLRTERLPHRWVLDPMVQRRIEPKDHAYEYVNGAFRPDTAKVLDLLGAVQLYGDELSALRELVQNALDAVRERMAWQRLGFEDQEDPLLAELLKRHELVLRLERRDDGRLWLECDDTGAGMTKEILTEHYLISGRGPNREVLELRRAARAAEIAFERTGQFGIGVLSYFMLADRVVLETRRCEEAPSPEAIAWRFETNGVGTFGELRRGMRRDAGTRLAMRLRPQLAELGDEELWSRVTRYLDEQLLVLPCAVRMVAPDGEERVAAAGWTASLTGPVRQPRRAVVEAELPDHLHGPRARDERARRHDTEKAYRAAAEQVRWQVAESELPDELGMMQLAIPYFELPGGPCLTYLRAGAPAPDGRIPIKPIAGNVTIELDGSFRCAWHGILVRDLGRAHIGFNRAVRVVLDLRNDDAARLDVSRNSLELSAAGRRAMAYAWRCVAHELRRFLVDTAGSRYCALNARLAAEYVSAGKIPPCEESEWLNTAGDGDAEASWWWEPVRYPVAEGSVFDKRYAEMSLGAEQLQMLHALDDNGYGSEVFSWAAPEWVPDRLVAAARTRDLVRVFDGPPRVMETNPLANVAAFPPTFRQVLGVGFERMMLLNPDHAAVQALDEPARDWAAAWDWQEDPLERRDEILASEARVVAWLLRLLQVETAPGDSDGMVRDLWDTLRERDAGFLEALWARLPRDGGDELVFFESEPYGDLGVVTLTPSAWTSLSIYDTRWERAWTQIPADWRLRPVED